MATVTQPQILPGILLEDVPWADYEAQLRIIGERHIRVNYDSGRMELISPTKQRGPAVVSCLLAWLVEIMVDEIDVQFEGADPLTLKRRDLEKGVEPDKLFYFRESAAKVQGNRELDLIVDPPPDLVIEVHVTHSEVPRLPIFAALGIPEVWRIDDDDDELQFLHLQPDGTYQPRDHSRAFPALLVAEAARFLEQGQGANKTAWIRTFRAYVRDVLVPQHQARPDDD
jgi:Uma2 family endonuclease